MQVGIILIIYHFYELINISKVNKFLFSYRKVLSLLFAIFAIVLIEACDPAFSPIDENDRYYSVFGFLNASADTQFIRIEQLRDSLFSDTPTDLNIEVELTNTSTGQSVEMKDSLFDFLSEGLAHNYYTTLPINPTETYRLEIVEGGTKTSAEVAVPEAFPEPELLTESKLKITGIDRLIGVKMIYSVSPICIPDGNNPESENCPDVPPVFQHDLQHLGDTTRMGNGVIHADIGQADDLNEIEQNYGPLGFELVRVKVVVAAGSPSWPEFIGLADEAQAIPGTASNIEGGVGLLGGVVTDTVLVYENESF